MANTILNSDIITRKALSILENKLVFARNVNHQYDDSFANESAKPGTTIRIRVPERAVAHDGATLVVDDAVQKYTTLTVDTQTHIGLAFTTKDLTMNIDNFSELFIEPRVSQLAASIDARFMAQVTPDVFNSVGTPGTTPATALVMLQAHQKMSEFAVPEDRRFLVVNPAANAALVDGLKGLFNPQGTISSQFRKGSMGENTLGYEEVSMSQSVPSLTTGTRPVSGLTIQGTISTQGTSVVNITGGSGAQTIKKGEVFTIANRYAINLPTGSSTGSLMQFVVKADATASSCVWTGVQIAPTIYTQTETLGVIDSFPTAGDVVTFIGAASSVYPQNLAYHRDAFTFATADLVMPGGVGMKSRIQHEGISMRMVQDYDINSDKVITRLDVLWGGATLDPFKACRVWG